MPAKKRILWVGEASWTNSGFATISREILKRLHASGLYDVFELCCYGSSKDQRRQSIPWTTFGNDPDNPQEEQIYRSSITNQWGEWKFEEILLKTQSQIVLDARDFWNFEYLTRSSLRRFYRLGLMPAWDSSPVNDQWVDLIKSADGLLSYSGWAVGEMRSQMGETPPILGTAPAGVDHDVFKVRNKAVCREALGITHDDLVVMMVARNQARKLIPDLMETFSLMRERAAKEIKPKLKLYLHTCWPDVGWDIPRFLREFGIGDATLFTYICRGCNHVFAHTWEDSRAYCPKCGGLHAMNPTADRGIDSEALAVIYGCADSYVQYAMAAAQEIPVVEAAACGVKSFVVDCTAMRDFPHTLRAEPISVQRYFWDAPTHTKRALPDNDECAAKLLAWLSLPETVRMAEGSRIAQACRGHYTWDRAASRWIELIESMPPACGWDEPVRMHQPQKLSHQMHASEYVEHGLRQIAGRPDLIGSYFHLRMVRDLERGTRVPHTGLHNFTEATGMDPHHTFVPYTYQDCEQDLLNLCKLWNHWEGRRGQVISTHSRPGS